jgi:hypothetical protein
MAFDNLFGVARILAFWVTRILALTSGVDVRSDDKSLLTIEG